MRVARTAVILALVAGAAGGAAAETGGEEPQAHASRLQLNWFPIVYYTPETSVAGGAGLVVTRRKAGEAEGARPDSLQAFFVYTAKNQSFVRLNPEVYLQDGRIRLDLALMHVDMPTSYFGIGNPAGLDQDEVDALEEEYTNRRFALEGTALFTLTGALRAGATMRFAADSLYDVQAGGDLAGGAVRGSAGGDVVGLGPALEWDSRDAAFAPAGGAWYRAWMRAHRDALGSDYGFEHYALDLRRYYTVRPGHVLALQVAADTVRGDVPFYELPSPPLRGLYQGVFVDRTAASFQAEWRFPARGRFAAAVFAGVGGVGDTLADVKPVDLWAAGAGVRYILNRAERITLRLDVGVSPLGVFPYFMVMEAF